MAFLESIPRPKYAIGIIPYSTSRQTINLGFKPKSLIISSTSSSTTANLMLLYDESYSTTKCKVANSDSTYSSDVNLGVTTANRIYSINDDGFSFNNISQSIYTIRYFAVGE